ncbi:MAG: hypothetical protein ACI9MJ_001718, partial [Alphaproteobacteria bacterium]
MLFTEKSATEKRADFRKALSGDRILK